MVGNNIGRSFLSFLAGSALVFPAKTAKKDKKQRPNCSRQKIFLPTVLKINLGSPLGRISSIVRSQIEVVQCALARKLDDFEELGLLPWWSDISSVVRIPRRSPPSLVLIFREKVKAGSIISLLRPFFLVTWCQIYIVSYTCTRLA